MLLWLKAAWSWLVETKVGRILLVILTGGAALLYLLGRAERRGREEAEAEQRMEEEKIREEVRQIPDRTRSDVDDRLRRGEY